MPEPLRVLMCLHSLQAGGVERDVLRFAQAWREHGIDAQIVVGQWQGELVAEAPDVPYWRLAPKDAKRRSETWRMITQLPAIIRSLRPDVLLLASNNHAFIGLAMRLLLGSRCPPIVLRVSMDLTRADLSGLSDFIDKWALRSYRAAFARFVAMAPPVRDQIINRVRVSPERVTTIMNGSMTRVELDRIATARDNCDRDHVGREYLAIGRLVQQKNFALLLDAFARIVRRDDRLTIVGEGADRSDLESRARQLGIDGQVNLPGYSLDVTPWLARADAFVLSSDFEGLGNVVIEALAAGLPIVATNCCVAMPMLTEGAGRLVPIRDVAALATAMDGVLDDGIDVIAARDRAAQFTTEATTLHWASLFDELAQARRVDRPCRDASATVMDCTQTLKR